MDEPDSIPYDVTETALQQFAYMYRYDDRNRCIWKKLPGADGISMVYDKADRLIFSQDGEQNKRNEWTFSIPDIFGRVALTGTYKGSVIDVSNQIVSAEFINNNGFMGTGYQLSNLTIGNACILTVNYYDNYDFMNLLADTVKTKLNYTYLNGYASQYINAAPGISAKGMLTGNRIYELNSNGNNKLQVNYYDDKGRVAQTRSTNFFGGYDFAYNNYIFTGEVEKTYKTHTTNLLTYTVSELFKNSYDHAGRLLTTSYKLNDNPEVLFAENSYDDFGRLTTKYRHNRTDTISNEYNIRNWATRIKNGGFDQKLYYNENLPNGATAFYNGNISANSWTYNKTNNCYLYGYDDLNRLSVGHTGGYKYGEEFYYDKNGNIRYLDRFDKWGSIADDMVFAYNGNQIKKIHETNGSSNIYGVKEYSNLSDLETEFFYDANGNMIADFDRDIVTIRYNSLNLPDTVQFKNGNQIINRYAADGTKLRTDYFTLLTPVAVPITKGEVCKWEYQLDVINQDTRIFADNYEYTFSRDPDPETHNDYYSLTRIGNSEGYAHFGANPRVYYYYYRKDHLGNNREVWRAHDKKVVQRTQYYPSGLPWGESEGANVQSYKYNGKEFIEMHGYDTYDYGWRGYYPAIQRFTSIDPLAEKRYSISPYAYCSNNPITRIDPTGMLDDDYFNYDGKYLGTDNSTTSFKIKITDGGTWDIVKTSEGTIDNESGEFISSSLSNSVISDEAALNVFQHYNPTDLPLEKAASASYNAGETGMITGNNKSGNGFSIKCDISGLKESGSSDQIMEIKNLFSHEKIHDKDVKNLGVKEYNRINPRIREQVPIFTQMNDSSFSHVRSGFKESIIKYAKENAMSFPILAIPKINLPIKIN